MKPLFKRGLFFTCFFILISMVCTFLLLDESLQTFWIFFYRETYLEVPIGFWILAASLGVGFAISVWSVWIERQPYRNIQQALANFLDSDQQRPINSNAHTLPKQTQRSLTQLEDLLKTQKTSLKKLSDELVETDEKMIQERVIAERQRLARELHDSVSQQLFAASMLLSALTESEHEPAHQKILKQTEQMIQQAQLEMRALLLHLRPVALNNKTLAQGLEDLLSELQAKVHCNIRHRLENIHLSKGAEDHLFRIAQETLSNTLRHANATEIDVLFIQRNHLAILRIQDNGIGFDQEDDKMGSYGLRNIKERAIEIGATCKVVSVVSQGTIIEVKLPIEKGVHEND